MALFFGRRDDPPAVLLHDEVTVRSVATADRLLSGRPRGAADADVDFGVNEECGR
jgi:hypothetical protein